MYHTYISWSVNYYVGRFVVSYIYIPCGVNCQAAWETELSIASTLCCPFCQEIAL